MGQTKYDDIVYVTKASDMITEDQFLKDFEESLDEVTKNLDRMRVYISVNSENKKLIQNMTEYWTDALSKIQSAWNITEGHIRSLIKNMNKEIEENRLKESDEEDDDQTEDIKIYNGKRQDITPESFNKN